MFKKITIKKTHFPKKAGGFSLIELLVSVTIFVFLTSFLLAKYGTFNQGVLLTNLAYDVALTIRNAQSYGLNVKSVPTATITYSNTFTFPYGVHFDTTTGSNNKIIFFTDSNANKIYDGTSEDISTYTFKINSTITSICVGAGACDNTIPVTMMDVTFLRPDPDAIISVNGVTYTYVEITLTSSSGDTKKVTVRSNGQITIL